MNGSVLDGRVAAMSIFRPVLLTTALCSLGSCGASGGSAEEKFHSSSSLVTAAGCAGVAGFDDSDDSAANGSEAVDWDGGENADRREGCGLAECDPGAEVKEEKLEKGAGDGVGAGACCPFAVLPCVTDESKAGPGISGIVSSNSA